MACAYLSKRRRSVKITDARGLELEKQERDTACA